MDLMKLYETNENFRGYVDRYAKHRGISTEEALSHSMVWSYAEYLKSRGKESEHDNTD